MKMNKMNDDKIKKYIGFGCFAQCDQVKIECVDCTVHRECLEEWKRIKNKMNVTVKCRANEGVQNG